MIQYLEKLIRDNWKNWTNEASPKKIDFLKINAGSGMRNKKVGFFIFGGSKPVFFVKTVREKKYNEIIKKSFKKSENIYRLLKDESIPKPIYFGNYQDVFFYLESAALGKQFHSCKTKKDLNKFLDWFFKFQRLMIKNEKTIRLEEYIDNLVNKFLELYKLEKGLKELIKNLAKNLKEDIGNLDLLSIIQHGDLTPDNVLNDKGRIKVIDWDNFTKIDLPLFDLLVFLQRWSAIRDISFIDEYSNTIKRYLSEFKVDEKALKSLVFCYYLLDFLRKKEILSDYDKGYLRARLKEIKELDIKI